MRESVVVPRAIRRVEDRIECDWGGGHLGTIPMRALRLSCRCAWCVDEISGRPLLDPDTVAADVRAVAIRPVGAYGIKVEWSDGHDAGIFTYRMLLAACRCPACRPEG